ncbi:probable 28S ribosomal protein S6, mitochondrial [Thrips palmi]|uniref:Small ribosomal subunit protein bS6m n=1 Tax=Thrips palmi TaxID=161013 RepID=A0A6P9A5S4_THRPL|nr:probable 28S ribosomal protein S6, mitochondrial [Thrips palmi]
MPTYELAILYRVLPRDQLAQALKTTANLIFQEGGIIRKLNNMGLNPTPYRMTSHGQKIKQANYFLYEFDIPAASVAKLREDLGKYDSIVRRSIYSPVTPIKPVDCQLEDEMQIAPFRKDVQEMLKRAKKLEEEKQRRKVKPNHNLPFNPFSL